MRKILVLDDNQDILETTAFVLSRRNMVVVTLSNALLHNYIMDHSPNLLLMDIVMGDYDGRNLCKIIKASPDHRQLLVVLFSARRVRLATITACGADGMIEKPFRINELYDLLCRLLPME